ncbi:MAG TPA: hypothetical protein VGW77_19680 [Candidatus Binatia bacterium]|jgi:hypothetical protein|nr:hypothetical protein [Candidatus Binatia bacterium]
MKTLEDKQVESRVQPIPRGRHLPTWIQPRTKKEAIAKINNATEEWGKTTEEFLYRVGGWFIWLRDKSAHGEFETAVSETRFKIRTVRNFMNYRRECDMVNRLLPYHPNPKAGTKPATVAVLESPEIESKEELKIKRPRHDSEPLNWSAAECAEQVFKIFEKLTQGRKIEEVENVAEILQELIRDYIEGRQEDKLMISGHGELAEQEGVER